jgi:hypothetical protein
MRRPVFPNTAIFFAAASRPAAIADPAHPAAPLIGEASPAGKARSAGGAALIESRILPLWGRWRPAWLTEGCPRRR